MKRFLKALSALLLASWTTSVSAVPIPTEDIVTVDGQEWAQVDLFTNLTWVEILEVCPGGIYGSGVLNGYDMSGWVWASRSDMNNLFNRYLMNAGVTGSDLLGPGPDSYSATPASGSLTWLSEIRSDGFKPTSLAIISTKLLGRIANNRQQAGYSTFGTGPAFTASIHTGSTASDRPAASLGAWFYRASTDVPAPGGLVLVSLGLFIVGWARGRKNIPSLGHIS